MLRKEKKHHIYHRLCMQNLLNKVYNPAEVSYRLTLKTSTNFYIMMHITENFFRLHEYCISAQLHKSQVSGNFSSDTKGFGEAGP